MAIRFRKRSRILPGVWLNVGKSGVSTSLGGKGVTVQVGERGARTTLSVPGTGLSYTHTAVAERKLAEPARSGRAAGFVAILLWVFLIGYLAWAMH